MKADLHVHTTNTDCSHSPETVFRMAKAIGITTIAVTDHDTLYGIDDNKRIAEETGIGYIPGIEISAYDYANDVPCHIVGLHVCTGYRPLEDMIAAVTESRHKHSTIQIQKLNKMGFYLSPEDFADKTGVHGIYKQHIMHALLEKGYVKQMFGSFYYSMFKKGGPLYLKIDYPKHTDAVRALAESGALPILAHPTQYNNTGQVEKLMECGLFGMEVSYPSANAEQTTELISICDQYGLFKSAGSDFHGTYAKDTTGYVGSHYASDIDAFLKFSDKDSEAV